MIVALLKGHGSMVHMQNGMVQGQWSMVHWAWCMMVHGACCKGHGAWKHGACAGWHHAMARIHGSQGMLYHSMVHASMKHRTFSPLFTVSLPSPSMPLKSETQLPLITASEIRDTLPLHFTTSEIRGIRCLCFQRHVSDFIDMSLISETSWVWNFRKIAYNFACKRD